MGTSLECHFQFGTGQLRLPKSSDLHIRLLERFRHESTENDLSCTAICVNTGVEASQGAVDRFLHLMTAEEGAVHESFRALDIKLVAEITAIADYFMMDAIVKQGTRRLAMSVSFQDSELMTEGKRVQECIDLITGPFAKTSLAALQDGRVAYLCRRYNIVRVWDLSTSRYTELTAFTDVFCGNLKAVSDKTLMCVTPDHVIMWDLPTGSVITQTAFGTQIQWCEFVNEDTLALSFVTGGIYLKQLSTGVLTNLEPLANAERLLIMNDGTLAAFCSARKPGHCNLALWDLSSRKLSRVVPLELAVPYFLKTAVELQDGRVACSGGKYIRVYDVQSGQFRSLDGHTDLVRDLALLPDGRLVSCAEDKTIKLWDVQAMCCTNTFVGHNEPVFQLAVLPDGRIVSSSYDEAIKISRTSVSKETKASALRALGVSYGMIRTIVEGLCS